MAGCEAPLWGLLLIWSTDCEPYVYIDGFNLYYGALKANRALRWLNVDALCRAYFPKSNIQAIKYFTAKIKAKPGDLSQEQRQNFYIRALETIPHLSVYYGHFLSSSVRRPLSDGSGMVDVIKTEEKGSDVNIACHLLHDAHLNKFDAAIVVSNDSDLLCPIQMVRNCLHKKVGLLNPHKKPSRELLNNSDFIKSIRKGTLASSQFPDVMTDKQGTFHRPKEWK